MKGGRLYRPTLNKLTGSTDETNHQVNEVNDDSDHLMNTFFASAWNGRLTS